MNIYLEILLLVLSYILGSIPFGLLLGKIKGIDLREVGSKNIGTTNAWRNLGPGLGILTLILDVFKAVIILGLVRYNVIPNEGIIIDPIFYGLAAAIGHTHSILSLIHISEPTRLLSTSYAVFCLKKKNNRNANTPF